MRYSWETCLSRRSLPHPPPWWRIPHHPPLGNSPRQRWGWRILMHDVWNILWRTFVYFNNLLMTDIMMRSSYFDLEEERSSGSSDSSSIWGRACSSKETDLKLEERKVVSRGLSSTISSSRLSMSYTLVDPPRWPFHIFAIIFWKDHKFVNYWKDRWRNVKKALLILYDPDSRSHLHVAGHWYLVLSSGKRHSSREVCWVLAEMFEAHWRAFAFAPQPPFPAPAHQPTPQIHQLAHLDQPPLRAGGANNFQNQQLDRPKGFYLFFIGHRMLPKAVFLQKEGKQFKVK